jgi:recombination protein RecT
MSKKENKMTESTAITKFDKTRATLRSDKSIERFIEVLGNKANAQAFISSVLIAVGNNPKLQDCSTASICESAMRAATLRLSVDPSLGHAHLVPYKGVCTFQVGYKGYEQLALRTGKYRYINLATIYEGQVVEENQLKGIHSIHKLPISKTAIGYMLYFELYTGYSKTFYMTVEECDAHGRQFAPSYNYDSSLWKTNPHAMYKKTVIKMGLSRWGYFDQSDRVVIEAADDSNEITADWSEVQPATKPPEEASNIIAELTGEVLVKPTEPQPKTAEPAPHEIPLLDRRKADWKSTRIAAETAASLLSSDGTPYMSMPIQDLRVRVIGLKKRLEHNGLTPEAHDETKTKLDCIQDIIALGIE